jgi:hypothetical protein
MNKEQLEVLNITQEVLRHFLLAVGTLNPQAMPKVALALRAGAAAGHASPMASRMLEDLAAGAEKLSQGVSPGAH